MCCSSAQGIRGAHAHNQPRNSSLWNEGAGSVSLLCSALQCMHQSPHLPYCKIETRLLIVKSPDGSSDPIGRWRRAAVQLRHYPSSPLPPSRCKAGRLSRATPSSSSGLGSRHPESRGSPEAPPRPAPSPTAPRGAGPAPGRPSCPARRRGWRGGGRAWRGRLGRRRG